MTGTYDIVELEGRLAYWEGGDPRDCPYTDSNSQRLWHQGFEGAARMELDRLRNESS